MKYIVLALIRFYRKCISPLFPPKCKYYPTCSCYAMTAVERFGAVRGSALAVWRILRCNPWSMGGIDMVPDRFTFRVKKYDPGMTYTEEEEKYENDIKRDEF